MNARYIVCRAETFAEGRALILPAPGINTHANYQDALKVAKDFAAGWRVPYVVLQTIAEVVPEVPPVRVNIIPILP